MGRYLLKRLIQFPLVLWILITISFFMMRAAPGGPFSEEKRVDPAILAKMNEKYGLSDPLLKQYARFLGNLAVLDLGPSFTQKTRTVNEIIGERWPVSAVLGGTAILLALLLGLTAGVIAAIRHNSRWDYGSMAVAMVGLSVPTFVVGPMLALLLGIWAGLFPVAGFEPILGTAWLPHPKFLLLPAFTLSLPFAARIARLTRAGMLEVIHQDYIRTAWAKGLSEQVIVLRHALRGALLPVVSFLGPATAEILTGSLVVEQVFAFPGLGREFVQSAINRDYTLVMGTVILFGSLLITFNLIVDVLYGFLDPRIRYA